MKILQKIAICIPLIVWLGVNKIDIPKEQESSSLNILWITTEDISPNLGCYGDPYAHTPNLDKLATEGVLYTNAFASAPVCAVARSSLITGVYASSLGSQHMRCAASLPKEIHTYPELLREAGYYCTNNVKTDFNLDIDDKSVWDDCSNSAHWRNRKDPDQPFFAIFNFHSTHESRVNDEERHREAIAEVPQDQLKQPGEIPVPPYFPNTPEVRKLWTRYYNNITAMDQQVGELLAQLEADGLMDNTLIFFYSDHGAGIPRHKRWLFDTGLQVPLIVKAPTRFQQLVPHNPGTKTDELVSFLDMPATALHLAGIRLPDYMQGRAFVGEKLSPERNYIYAGRDRMDERYDMQRAVRDKQYKYIRYYEPYKPYCQYMNTPEKGAIMHAIRQAEEEGNMPEEGQHIIAPHKPEEALYDLANDPDELINLARNPAYEEKLIEMRAVHAQWSDETHDTGLIPETIINQWEEEMNMPIYIIMREKQVPVTEIRETALGQMSEQELTRNLNHENAAVRYWAAIQLGNLQTADALEGLQANLEDPVPAVSIAAARAVALMDEVPMALAVLEQMFAHDDEWVRLLAAQVLDEMDEGARPAIPALKGVMDDSNKYVVRVANHALNQLQGTQHIVR